MSLPERLWRLARRRLFPAEAPADEGLESPLAEAAAWEELAEALRPAAPPRTPSAESRRGRPAPASPPEGAAQPAGPTPAPSGGDPLAACYALLRLPPGADLRSVEAAYRARCAELRPERHPPGSARRAAEEGERRAVEAAYQRLRDALNPTETRFEHIEF